MPAGMSVKAQIKAAQKGSLRRTTIIRDECTTVIVLGTAPTNTHFTDHNGKESRLVIMPAEDESTVTINNGDQQSRVTLGGRSHDGQSGGPDTNRSRKRYRGDEWQGAPRSALRTSGVFGDHQNFSGPRKSARFANMDSPTSKYHRPRYDPAKADAFDAEKWATWASRHTKERGREVMDLTNILAEDLWRQGKMPSINPTVYASRQMSTLFQQECPEESKMSKLTELLKEVYTHAGAEKPSEEFWNDLREPSPGPAVPPESLHAYLDSCMFYGQPKSGLQPADFDDWKSTKPRLQRGLDFRRATRCAAELARALPSLPNQSGNSDIDDKIRESDIKGLTDKLVLAGTRYADNPDASLAAMTGEVIGLMTTAGYSSTQCEHVQAQLPSLLETIKSGTHSKRWSFDKFHIHREMDEMLRSKIGRANEAEPVSSSPTRHMLSTASGWLPNEDDLSRGTESQTSSSVSDSQTSGGNVLRSKKSSTARGGSYNRMATPSTRRNRWSGYEGDDDGSSDQTQRP